MIPESSAVGEIRLYKASKFPFEWRLEKVLSEVKKTFVDSLFLFENGKSIVVTSYVDGNKKDITEVYELDMAEKKLVPISGYEITSGRAAGNFIQIGDKIIRPLQNHITDYGNSMTLYSYEISGDGLTGETVLGEI
ncbi:MAG: hypothetical protein IJZ94_00835 [Clostridia bacterium]|nr:hypothetical protein [Clostridia bacterium]